MGKTCYTCGGIGNADLIVTCSRCRGHEHVYCMRTIHHEVPDEQNWLCQTCLLKNETGSSKDDVKEDNTYTFVLKSPDISPISHSMSPRRAPNSGKHVSGKVKYLTPEEAISLSSETITRRPSYRQRPGPANATACISRRTPISSRTASPNTFLVKVKANPHFLPSGHGRPSIDGNVQPNAMISKLKSGALKELKGATKPTSGIDGNHLEGLKGKDRVPVLKPKILATSAKDQVCTPTKAIKILNAKTKKATNNALCAASTSMDQLPNISSVTEKKDPVSCIKEHICEEQPINVVISAKENGTLYTEKAMNMESCASLASRDLSPIINLGGNLQDVTEPKKSDVEERDLLNILPEFKQFLPYFPALEITWKGGFKILEGEVCGEFWAHPSSKVHRKAYEFAKKMPPVLEVKLLPRSHLWEDLFQDNCPNPRDIALYFLPGNLESSKGNNAWLVKLMEVRDVVMKSCIDGVELLVITSKQLLMDSPSGIGGSSDDYFLWGVFRRAKNDVPVSTEHNYLSNLPSGGGQNVGRVDIVVSKDSCKRVYGSSTRDETTHWTPEAKISTDLRNMESSTRQQSVKMKRDQRNDSDSYTGLMQKVKCDSTNKITLSSAMKEMNLPPGFEGMPRVKLHSASSRATFREEKPHQVNGRFMSSVRKENIGHEGVSENDFSIQSQKLTQDSDSSRTLKHNPEPARDLAKNPRATYSRPLSKKGTKSVLEIIGEKLVEVEGKGNTAICPSNGCLNPFPVVIKAEKSDGEKLGQMESMICSQSTINSSNRYRQSFPIKVKDEVKVETRDVIHEVSTTKNITSVECDVPEFSLAKPHYTRTGPCEVLPSQSKKASKTNDPAMYS